MDKDFEKLIRNKRKRKISVCIVILFIVLTTLFSFKTENGKEKKKSEVTLKIRCDELIDNPEKMCYNSVTTSNFEEERHGFGEDSSFL